MNEEKQTVAEEGVKRGEVLKEIVGKIGTMAKTLVLKSLIK